MGPENCAIVGTAEDLVRILEGRDDDRTVLFLHDPWCPISRRAAREVESFGSPVALVDVSKQHELSRMIETRTGIRHESPQVIVLAAGQPVWNASHGAIIARDIALAWEGAGKADAGAA